MNNKMFLVSLLLALGITTDLYCPGGRGTGNTFVQTARSSMPSQRPGIALSSSYVSPRPVTPTAAKPATPIVIPTAKQAKTQTPDENLAKALKISTMTPAQICTEIENGLTLPASDPGIPASGSPAQTALLATSPNYYSTTVAESGDMKSSVGILREILERVHNSDGFTDWVKIPANLQALAPLLELAWPVNHCKKTILGIIKVDERESWETTLAKAAAAAPTTTP